MFRYVSYVHAYNNIFKNHYLWKIPNPILWNVEMLSCHWTLCVDQYLLATAEKNVLITRVNKNAWLISSWFVEISKFIHAREELSIMRKFCYPEMTITVNNFRIDIHFQSWYMKWYMNMFILIMYINICDYVKIL